MSDRQIRGYMLTCAYRYLKDRIGEEAAKAAFTKSMSPADRDLLQSAKSTGWYPAEVLVQASRVIAATVGGGDEAKTREAFIGLGTFTATEATGTFLKLLMRVLTPNLLAKRFPELWSRDVSRGTARVEIGHQKLCFYLSDIEGFEYCGPVAMGWTSFVLGLMGKDVKLGELNGWSLANPGPESVSFELSWTN
jgi:hypothetical protein